MYPHERSLVKRLADKPFALLGINSDRDKVALKKRMDEERITWRSWWDGGDTNGPIASGWNVSGWPTIYIVDAKGVIRYKSVGADEAAIDKAIRKLLAEMGQPFPDEKDEPAEKPGGE
jgi:hypothetical protein